MNEAKRPFSSRGIFSPWAGNCSHFYSRLNHVNKYDNFFMEIIPEDTQAALHVTYCQYNMHAAAALLMRFDCLYLVEGLQVLHWSKHSSFSCDTFLILEPLNGKPQWPQHITQLNNAFEGTQTLNVSGGKSGARVNLAQVL